MLFSAMTKRNAASACWGALCIVWCLASQARLQFLHDKVATFILLVRGWLFLHIGVSPVARLPSGLTHTRKDDALGSEHSIETCMWGHNGELLYTRK